MYFGSFFLGGGVVRSVCQGASRLSPLELSSASRVSMNVENAFREPKPKPELRSLLRLSKKL